VLDLADAVGARGIRVNSLSAGTIKNDWIDSGATATSAECGCGGWPQGSTGMGIRIRNRITVRRSTPRGVPLWL